MIDIQAPNKEVFTGEFDCERERAALVKLTRDETVEVIEFIGPIAMVASARGVKMIQLPDDKAPPPGCYVVRHWKGKVWNARYKRNGAPFDFGPYEIKFYHRDRVAEILRKHKDAK